jgi:hypothetical protein
VNANAIDTPADNPVIEEYSYIHSIDCRVKIRNGSAIITALSYGFQSVTRIEMTVEIQEKFALFWITKSTWNESVNSDSLQMVKNYVVTSGKTYRAKVKVTVYTASGSETATVTSATQKAN